MSETTFPGLPPAQGLYDPAHEHDACGVGFVADLKNRKKHDIIRKAIQVLINLEHRGACGCEANTGDGAGVVMQTPDGFLRQECDRLNIRLPAAGEYGVGSVFLPADAGDRKHCEELFEYIVRKQGQDFAANVKGQDVGKYTTKAINGFWHSFAFTTGRFPDNIQITPRNHRITEAACRSCHGDIVHAIEGR